MALIFVTLPFVVRTLQPVIEDIEAEVEEAAFPSGPRAGRPSQASSSRRSFRRLTGFALAFPGGGRIRFGHLHRRQPAAGFGNHPLLIISKLEQYDVLAPRPWRWSCWPFLRPAARHQRPAVVGRQSPHPIERTLKPPPQGGRSRMMSRSRRATRGTGWVHSLLATGLGFLLLLSRPAAGGGFRRGPGPGAARSIWRRWEAGGPSAIWPDHRGTALAVLPFNILSSGWRPPGPSPKFEFRVRAS